MDNMSVHSPNSASEMQLQKEVITCNTCNVVCSGRIPYEQHISGAQHRLLSAGPFHCSICNTTMNSQQSYEAHLVGSKHKRKAEIATTTTREITPEHDSSIAVQPSTTGTVSEEFKCIACDLMCSSSEQLSSHLSGKKHARRCKQQAELLVESSARSQDESSDGNTSTAPVVQQKNRLPRASRKRALISYTKSQTESGISRLCELESLTTVDFMTPTLFLLPACIHRKSANDEDGPELEGKRKAMDSDTISDKPFCSHIKCMFSRALKYYELGMEKLHADRNGGLAPKKDEISTNGKN